MILNIISETYYNMKLGSKMEQFTTLAKTGTGKSLEIIISQVLTDANIWIFGELLNMPNVQAVIFCLIVA